MHKFGAKWAPSCANDPRCKKSQIYKTAALIATRRVKFISVFRWFVVTKAHLYGVSQWGSFAKVFLSSLLCTCQQKLFTLIKSLLIEMKIIQEDDAYCTQSFSFPLANRFFATWTISVRSKTKLQNYTLLQNSMFVHVCAVSSAQYLL